MPLYKYEAKNLQGEIINGELNIVSVEELEKQLRGQGYFLLSKKIVGNGQSVSSSFGKVTVKDLSIFCRQFAVIISAGIGILEAIDILRQQATKKRMNAVLSEIYDDLRRGTILSDSMAKHVGVFPDFMLNMIKVGEVSGNLDTILEKVAEYYERDSKIRAKVKGAMVYPIILLVLMIGVVVLLMLFVLPIFADTLSGFGGEMPTITKVLMDASAFMVANILMIAVVIGGIVGGMYFWMKTYGGERWKDGLKLVFPVIGPLQRKIITSRFARSMATLLRSGISVIDAMDIMHNLLGNKVVEDRFEKAQDEVKKGMGVAGPLDSIGVFSPLLINMVRVGEKTGELDDMLDRTSGFFDEEVEDAINTATTLLEPIMIVLLAVVVGTVLLSVMLPMVNIMESVY